MLKDIVAVKPLGGYQLSIRFEDGVEGVVDVAKLVSFRGVFAPLRDAGYFERVRVNTDTGTICWENDADLDPDVLYSIVTGMPITLPEVDAVSV